MKFTTKGLILAIIAAMIGVFLYLYTYLSTKKHFKENLNVNRNLLFLQLNINKLKVEILQSSSFVYKDYNKIYNLVDETKGIFKKIKMALINNSNKRVLLSIETLENNFDIYVKDIHRYLTLNLSLKRMLLNIPDIQLKASSLFEKNTEALIFFINIYPNIFISKNSFDDGFIRDIWKKLTDINRIERDYKKDTEEYKLLENLRLNLINFVAELPIYHKILTTLLDDFLDKQIVKNIHTFQEEYGIEIEKISRYTIVLLILYISALFLIIHFIYEIDEEKLELMNLKKRLENVILKDNLTSLRSMRAFNIDVRRFQHPSLILINIDRFKHINEFYGTKIGDIVLLNVAYMLQNITEEGFVYRLGGDDFGILFENCDENITLAKYVDFYNKQLSDYKLHIDEMLIEIKFSIGASSNKKRLFETADMALRLAKNLSRKKYIIYTRKIDKTEEIKADIETIRHISLALEEDRLKAYYQPIHNIRTDKIERYEALARIELVDGSLLKPSDFMSSAVEAKLSSDITITMLKQIIDMARENIGYEFSINISTSDIIFYKDREAIIDMVRNNIDVANRLIFELLESEDIYNYEIMNGFIKEVKSLGCKIAIDDFGSGYSNFEKILNLDIDILKIDGSLVQNIDRDRHLRLVIKTILRFAKYANFSTIAEFVYSESIYHQTKRLQFDYAQGYYIGEPSAELQQVDVDKES